MDIMRTFSSAAAGLASRLAGAGACVVAMVLGMSACSPEGGMAGVSQESAKAVQRTDRFQAAATTGEHIVVVGAFGTVAVSADGGKAWHRNELPGAPALTDIAACGNGMLAALDVNGAMWRTGRTAKDWSSAPVPAADTLLAAACDADSRLWVSGARGGLFVSADGGRTWADRSISEDIQLLNIQFPAPGFGVIAGEFGRVLVSRDNGATWSEGGSLGEDFYPLAMHFESASRGLVVGLGGAVLETVDGGASWERTKAPTDAPLYGVRALPGGNAVVVGAGGTALRRAGGQWQPIEGVPKTDLRGIAVTPSSLIVAGAGAIVALPTAVASAQ